MEMVEVQVLQLCGTAAEGLDEDVRHAGDAGQVDVVAAADGFDGLVGAYVR